MVRAANPRYRAVFMDHMMPEMDGIEATRHIREEIGTTYAQTVPIIALTANAIVGNEEMFLTNGFQDFLSKPIDMVKLDAVLRRWVRDKNAEKELEESAEPQDSAARYAAAGITISGIDTGKALEHFSGDATVFIDILRSYASGTHSLLSKLRGYLAAENLADYAITVHGIKGSSYGIFAQKTGKAAEELEMAALSGNLTAVKAGHPVFESMAEGLLQEIAKTLAAIDAPLTPAPAPRPKILVVADSGTLLRSMKGWLGGSYDVSLANSGAMAIKYLSLNLPDLILLDEKLPNSDRQAVAELILAKNPAIQLLFLTEQAGKTLPVPGLTTASLAKTLSPSELAQKIGDFLLKKML
jgi:CheY-like chemotaxis protein